jgi:hypothetical protein
MTGVHHGTVSRVTAAGVFLKVRTLDRNREYGPAAGLAEVVLVDGSPTTRTLAQGDRVLVAAVAGDPNVVAVLRRLP